MNRDGETAKRYLDFIEVGRTFAIRVREALCRLKDLGPNTVFFSYDTGALETLEWCRDKGIRCILGQIDPNRVEVDLVKEEERRWPGWVRNPLRVPEEYLHRREREWALADRVVVNSEFCRNALLEQGVPQDKLLVIPLCYETEDGATEQQDPMTTGPHPAACAQVLRQWSRGGSPLRVLFLGQVILRKGIQYLIEAARQLHSRHIRFDVVGTLGISSEAVNCAPENVVFHGKSTRDQVSRWYRQSDVFVLPTISDGFAITQLEAMAHGLPLVVTPRCGAIIRDGLEGIIVPPGDSCALAHALDELAGNPETVRAMGLAASERASAFSLELLSSSLCSLEQQFGL